MHDGFNVVARKQSGHTITHTLEPSVIIFLDDVDDGALYEGKLVVFVLCVVIDGHH